MSESVKSMVDTQTLCRTCLRWLTVGERWRAGDTKCDQCGNEGSEHFLYHVPNDGSFFLTSLENDTKSDKWFGIDWAKDYERSSVCLDCAANCECEIREQEDDLPDVACKTCGQFSVKFFENDWSIVLLGWESDVE